METEKKSFEFFLQPDWEELDKIPEIAQEFVSLNELSIEDEHAILMVATELVENSIKYGYFPETFPKIHLTIKFKRNKVIIETRNSIKDADVPELKSLDSMIQWVRGFQNPFEAYVERLKKISGKELKVGESGLGLVRIAYEGQSILDFYIDENNILAVSAIYHIEERI